MESMCCVFSVPEILSILVAVLSLLVTILIGWNIWSVIDNKGLEKKFQRELNYIHNKADYNQAIAYAILSQTISAHFAPNEGVISKVQMLVKGITAIKTLSNFPDCSVEIEKTVSTLIKGLKNSEEIKIPSNAKEEIIFLCKQISNSEKIRDFKQMVGLIRIIKTTKE